MADTKTEAEIAAEAAAAASAVVAAAAATPAPAVAPVAAAAPATPPKGRGGPAKIEIPSDEFAKRVQREAKSLLRRKIGTDDIDEITALVERGRKATPAAAAAAAVPGTPAPVVDPETERLRAKTRELEAQVEEERSRRRKVKNRARANEMDLRLRHSALVAGVKSDDVDYALERYKRAVGVAPEGKAPMPDAFWAELRKTQAFLFAGAAPAPAPVPLSPTSAPPEGAAAGEAPKPNGAAAPRPVDDVEKLDSKGFEDRTMNRYGYRPPRVA
jgi:hypothetical protein